MVWGEKPDVTALRGKAAAKIEEKGLEQVAEKQMAIEGGKGDMQKLVEKIPILGDLSKGEQRADVTKDLKLIASAKGAVK